MASRAMRLAAAAAFLAVAPASAFAPTTPLSCRGSRRLAVRPLAAARGAPEDDVARLTARLLRSDGLTPAPNRGDGAPVATKVAQAAVAGDAAQGTVAEATVGALGIIDLAHGTEKARPLLAEAPRKIELGDLAPAAAPPSVSPPTPTYIDCMKFAIPALGLYVAGPLMSMIDTAFVGRITGPTALAALGPATVVADGLNLVLIFLGVATTNFVASALASKDVDEAARATTTGLVLSAAVGIGFGALLRGLATPLSLAMVSSGSSGAVSAATAELVPLAASYVQIRALALPAALVGVAAQAACLGAKDTFTPMISVALAAALNLCGDFLLVPHTGIVGAAIATAVSQYAAAMLLLRQLHKKAFVGRKVFKPRPNDAVNTANAANAARDKDMIRFLDTADTSNSAASDKDVVRFLDTDRTVATYLPATPRAWFDTVKPFFAFGPFFLCCIIKQASHTSAAMSAAAGGPVSAAAHTVILSVAMFCFTLGDVGSSLSQAFLPAYSKKPREGGGGEPTFDLKAAMPAIRSVMKATLSVSAMCVLVSSWIITRGAGAFTTDAAVTQAIRGVLPMTALTLAAHASAVTLEGLLLVRRDMPFLCRAYALLAVLFLGANKLIVTHNLGLNAVWGVYIGFQWVRVAMFGARGLELSGVFKRRGKQLLNGIIHGIANSAKQVKRTGDLGGEAVAKGGAWPV